MTSAIIEIKSCLQVSSVDRLLSIRRAYSPLCEFSFSTTSAHANEKVRTELSAVSQSISITWPTPVDNGRFIGMIVRAKCKVSIDKLRSPISSFLIFSLVHLQQRRKDVELHSRHFNRRHHIELHHIVDMWTVRLGEGWGAMGQGGQKWVSKNKIVIHFLVAGPLATSHHRSPSNDWFIFSFELVAVPIDVNLPWLPCKYLRTCHRSLLLGNVEKKRHIAFAVQTISCAKWCVMLGN